MERGKGVVEEWEEGIEEVVKEAIGINREGQITCQIQRRNVQRLNTTQNMKHRIRDVHLLRFALSCFVHRKFLNIQYKQLYISHLNRCSCHTIPDPGSRIRFQPCNYYLEWAGPSRLLAE